VELPQAPACSACNHDLGNVERKVREEIGFAIDPWIEGGEGIGDKSLRAIDPSKAKNPKDRERRHRAQQKLATKLQRVSELPARVIPNIGRLDASTGDFAVTNLDVIAVGKVIRKWVRGFTHYFTAAYIEDDYDVVAKMPGEDVPEALRAGVTQRLEIGPGIIVERIGANDEPLIALYVFTLWSRIRLLGSVERKTPTSPAASSSR